MEMAKLKESKGETKDLMDYQINHSSDDSGYISEPNNIDKDRLEILEIQNQQLQDKNKKLQNELTEMKKVQENLKEEIKRKDVKIIDLNKKVECDMEKAVKSFERSINSERELSSKMHNQKLQLIEKNLTKMVDNKTINEAVTSLGINMNATKLRNGEIKTLVLIGEYFSQIEKYEESIQEQIFLKHVDKSVINLLGGKSEIENKSLKEIKDKVFNMTVEIESIERLIHLGSLDWKGDTEPLVYRMELEKLYNCYNYDKNLQLSFNEILKNNITNNFSESKKDIFCTMFKKDPEEAMRKLCEKYNYKGKNYFFNESICLKTRHTIEEHPKVRKKDEKFTKYQGQKKSIGEFSCLKCKRWWISYNTWSNCAQECIKCHTQNYPYRQRPLHKPDGLYVMDRSKPHLKNLCGKCKTLGYCCKRITNKIKA